ncbi:MAG: UDP-N-acetylglucosamine--N-acetylmuramyl-(pentapeptide) pyrophosphoryl-undecaprenol N-acetylglucosamine transferase [Oscillospiraceae bacterium]
MNILFTCGGTAGHINPALALADLFRTRHPDTKILFAGAVGDGMENTLVPQAGYELRTLNVNSFRRKLNWAGLKHNCKAVCNLSKSRRQAKKLLDEFQPDLVVGTGGFASYPIAREAAKRGIPTAVHESNAVPGLTTRTLANYADIVMVGFEDCRSHYPHPERVVVTGTPVRPDFYSLTRKEAREKLGYTDDLPILLTYWGSLGAREMNSQMAEFIRLECAENAPFHHICGAGGGYKTLQAELDRQGIDLKNHPNVELREYIYDMPAVMASCDLIFSRAGASTISEILALHKPAVLVPSPNVTGDHQTKNAKLLSDKNAAVLLPEGECTAEKLYALAADLLASPEKRQDLMGNLEALSPADANEEIYKTLSKLAGKGPH